MEWEKLDKTKQMQSKTIFQWWRYDECVWVTESMMWVAVLGLVVVANWAQDCELEVRQEILCHG